MRIKLYMVIDREKGKAVLGSLSNLSDELHKTKSAIYHASQTYGYMGLGARTVEVHQLHLGYNFYDSETGELVMEHKSYSRNPKIDETGYEESEMRAMLNNEFGYDGLKAKMVIYAHEGIKDFPSELYEELLDVNVIRRYKRQDEVWKEYYL